MLGVSRQMRLRCSFPAIALVFVLACASQLDAASAQFSKPIRFIVPYAPGGGTDIVARVYGANLSKRIHQPVVVENRPGASGAVGVEVTAKAPPDSNTICIVSASNTVNSATNQNLPYDLTRDLQGVSQLISQSFVLVVNSSSPIKSVADLIAYAKANPGKLNFGSSGTGGVTHLAGVLLASVTNKHGARSLPRGSCGHHRSDERQDSIPVCHDDQCGPAHRFGRLRAIAVSAGKRIPPHRTSRPSPKRVYRGTKSTSGMVSRPRPRLRKPSSMHCPRRSPHRLGIRKSYSV